MRRIFIISLLLITLFSCDNKFPEYVKKEDGVYMKLLSFGEGNKIFSEAKYVAASIEITGNEGLLYKKYREDVINVANKDFTFLIQHLSEGDSCSFMVSTSRIINEFKPKIFNKTTSDFVEVSIKIHQYYTEDEYLAQNHSVDKEMLEQMILTKYLEELEVKPLQGIYIQQLAKGKEKKIKKGDIITISYKGYFTNRLEFDNVSGSTAFTFAYGTPGQVIKGLNLAIKGMKKGEKSKIIIPSQLAFGEEGSSTLVVPPFTTVIYELEIVNVKQAKIELIEKLN